eukprot:TRINITY_DN14613_c0_g1_i1.p2 TRINITY_DN14613_c0_g1~~TRINITY_DN14613_c0_g1_i1.p2  ORF type:complete len:242 (+),score=105.40 TRINITY_DN14613_c0_g1_i1:53-778(+)
MSGEKKPVRGLLLDMDGVLAEVKQSYRQCIVDTAAAFGSTVTFKEITAEKLKGNANNDWVLTRKMLADRGIEASLQDITDKFEEIYSELRKLETLIPAVGVIEELHRRCEGRVAIVTGRPRKDCEFFLEQFGLSRFVSHSVCMEDGPPKPAPNAVETACKHLDLHPAETLMIGDTVDDILAAVSAGGRGVGTLLPDDHARTVIENAAFETVPSVVAMLEKGAESIIRPGLADLLDHIPLRS